MKTENRNKTDSVQKTPILTRTHSGTIISVENAARLISDYGLLPYHIEFYNQLASQISLRDKIVLEIGGSNTPKDLALRSFKARKWVCVDKPSGYRQKLHEAHYNEVEMLRFDGTKLSEILKKSDYIVFNEYAEHIPESFYDEFDVCISNACFEHVINLPAVLDAIYGALKENGILYAHFGPLWSAPEGNHLDIEDEENGATLHKNSYPESAYHCHLLMGYAEIYGYVKSLFGESFAKRHTYTIKNGREGFLNKLFYEDYLFLLEKTPFIRKSLSATSTRAVKNESMRLLQVLYPGYYRFDVSSALIQAAK